MDLRARLRNAASRAGGVDASSPTSISDEDEEQASQLSGSASDEEGSESSSDESNEDGPEWYEGYDEGRKAYYYFNTSTQQSQWTKPNAPFVPHKPGGGGSESEESSDEESSDDESESSRQEPQQVARSPPARSAPSTPKSGSSPVQSPAQSTSKYESDAPRSPMSHPSPTPPTSAVKQDLHAYSSPSVQSEDSSSQDGVSQDDIRRQVMEVVSVESDGDDNSESEAGSRKLFVSELEHGLTSGDAQSPTSDQHVEEQGGIMDDGSIGAESGRNDSDRDELAQSEHARQMSGSESGYQSDEGGESASQVKAAREDMRRAMENLHVHESYDPVPSSGGFQTTKAHSQTQHGRSGSGTRVNSKTFVERSELDRVKRQERRERELARREEDARQMANHQVMNKHTKNILRKNGLLKQDMGEVVVRLHEWNRKSKKRAEEAKVKSQTMDPITGKPLFTHTAWTSTKRAVKSRKPKAWVAMSPPEADPEATESLFQKAFERKLITKLEHSEQRRKSEQQRGTESKYRTRSNGMGGSMYATQEAVMKGRETPSPKKALGRKSQCLMHTRVKNDLALLYELYADHEGLVQFDGLVNVLKGLDVVSEEQASENQTRQYLKRVYLLLTDKTPQPASQHPYEATIEAAPRGVCMQVLLDFVKVVISGRPPEKPAQTRTDAVTVEMLAMSEERDLAVALHELYAVNTLNRKVRNADARRAELTARRAVYEEDEGPKSCLSQGSKQILRRLKSEGRLADHVDHHFRDESKIERMRRELEEEERAECTFTPQLCPGSQRKAAKNLRERGMVGSDGEAVPSSDAVFHKLYKQPTHNTQDPQTSEDKEFDEHCTFKPRNYAAESFSQLATSAHREKHKIDEVIEDPTTYGHSGSRGRRVLNAQRSTEDHVDRMRRARERHDEEKAIDDSIQWRQYPSPKKSNGTPRQRVTEVVPFELSTTKQAQKRAATSQRRRIEQMREEEEEEMRLRQQRMAVHESANVVAAQASNRSRLERNKGVTPLLHVEVLVGSGQTETLKLWPDDDPVVVAKDFAAIHRLPKPASQNLEENLRYHLSRVHVNALSDTTGDLFAAHAQEMNSGRYYAGVSDDDEY